MDVTRSMLSTCSYLLLLCFALAGPARAEPSDAERTARWSDLRHAIFGDRVVEDAGDLVAIDAPARAEDAAIVPVAIRVAEMLGPDPRPLSRDRRQSVAARRSLCSGAARRRSRNRHSGSDRRLHLSPCRRRDGG